MCTDELACCEEDMAAANVERSSGSSGGEMEAFQGVASSLLLVGDPARGLACTSEQGPICHDVPFFLSSDASPDASALAAAVDKRAALGIRGRSSGECLEDCDIERVECRRNSGFSLPRFCREKNAQQEAGKRFGFVVSRRRRSLSLDDQSVLISADSRDSKMKKMMTSRDDSCLPFMTDCSIAQLKRELMSPSTTTILTKRGSGGLSAERSMSFACHSRGVGENHQLQCRQKQQQHEESCYDLVGSPGPKFLLNVTLAEAFDSPLTPFKTAAAVPFKWEVAPGKPKPEAAAPKPERSLQLPPRLLVRSFTAKHAEQQSSILSPDRQRQQRRAQSVNHRHGGLLQLGIRSAESPRHKSEAEKQHDPCSPTSILCGPESGSTSSSSDTLSVSDSECCRAPVDPSSVSDAESATTLNQQQDSPTPPSQEEVSSSSSCALGPPAEYKSSSLADSIAKIFHLGRAKWGKKKKNHHQEVQMWAPTLAAYFHSSNERSSAKGGDNSGQLVLLEDSDTPWTAVSDSVKSSASVIVEESVRSSNARVESDEGEGYCGCSSPRFAPFSPSSQLRSLKRGSGKQKKWVVRRIRRSSRLFQTFVFKAVKHAVQPRRKSPLDSSKLLYNSVQS